MNDFELRISPLKTYKAPDIPTFEDKNPTLLNKLPSRWQKNAKVIACIGLTGTVALSGCTNNNITPVTETHPSNIEHDFANTQGSYHGYSQPELSVRLHTGGGGASFYVVHLTEQEAFGILRARLEAAGLNFNARPPGYTLEHWWDEIDLDLFDEQKNVAITHFGWEESNRPFSAWGQEFTMQVEEAFTEITNNIIVGAFYTPGIVSWENWDSPRRRPSRQEVAEASPVLTRQVINQADAFIARLQSQGVLERFPNVNVTINGTSASFGSYPIVINNLKMVPALEAFELLGMVVNSFDNGSRQITARKNDVLISVQISSWNDLPSMTINDEWVGPDIPLIMHNNEVLIPLQFVAEAIGATIDWDENTQTIRIITN